MFRRWAPIALLLALLAPAPAAAQEATLAPGAQLAIRQVIESQLAAFQRDDGSEAFSYASPGIRDKFATPEIFMEMVRSGYAPVYRPREVEFLDARVRDGRTGQAVRFVGPDGRTVIAVYTMEQQPDGTWRISGVILVPAEETAS